MAKDGNGTLIGLAIAGAVGYYGYTQGWFSSLFGSSAASSGSSTSGAPGGAGTSSSGSGAAPYAPSSSPSYSGPSLDQMFQSLQAAVKAAFGVDPHLSCAGMSGFGILPGHGTSTGTSAPPTPPPIIGRQGFVTDPNPLQITDRRIGGVVAQRPAAPVSGPSSCANPMATYDVFNWYLTNRAGGPAGPNPPDHTSVVSLTDYWTWAAPLLKQAIPGLAGGFNGGLGGYAELGMILERQAGGF